MRTPRWMILAAALSVASWLWLAYGQTAGVLPGSPLPGLTPFEFELFSVGLDDFTEVEDPSSGLGPAFNGTSCAVCHSVPAIGGSSAMNEIRACHRDEAGKFTALNGGTLYHLFSIPPHTCQVTIPPQANVIARRAPIPVFGLGLVEAIPDSTIAALEDPDDRDSDGVSGRAARIIDVATGRERIGRFGWKSQHATLLAFSGDAYLNEMGITNDLFPHDIALGVDPEQLKLCSPTRGINDVRDRRTQLRALDNFANFMKFLAPIARGPIDDSVRSGEALFRVIGCATCHVPTLMTGASANRLFDRKPVALFSDLLLHDVGTGDGIVQEAAAAEEIRTPALWGLRFRRPLLHDGSAATPAVAIERHTGEAAQSINLYRSLSPIERERLIDFLGSL